jgi:uncharacterized protein YeaO (DUF488 family)
VSLRVGRVYDPVTVHDGARVLVDRLWPRGITRARAELDEWCRDIAPSNELRRWYHHEPGRFTEFRRRYHLELATPEGPIPPLLHLAELARGRTLTLLTASKDPMLSQAAVLVEVLANPSDHL